MSTTTTPSISASSERASATREGFRPVVALVGVYLGLSALTIVAAIVFASDPSLVNTTVWIRGSIVVVTAALMLRFAMGARSGNARHYRRLRLVSAIMVVVIAVILVAIPGDFPLWMRIEQATCGAILVVVVILANRKRVRESFAAGAAERAA
ncbi:MAG TPA: hypothetical protein VHZ81_09495 [Galbitalea sp.]|nr:hypothetical protein [Galbitalea sp.]